jgi:hypothetical protein
VLIRVIQTHSAPILMDPSRALAMLATREMEWHVPIKMSALVCSTITAPRRARFASMPSAALDAEHQHLLHLVPIALGVDCVFQTHNAPIPMDPSRAFAMLATREMKWQEPVCKPSTLLPLH